MAVFLGHRSQRSGGTVAPKKQTSPEVRKRIVDARVPAHPRGTVLSSAKVIGALADVMVMKGVPEHLRSDNGPEFVGDFQVHRRKNGLR